MADCCNFELSGICGHVYGVCPIVTLSAGKGKLNRNTFWKSALTVIVPCLLCAVDIVSTKVLGAMHLIVSAKKSIHTAGIGQTLRTILITQIDILKMNTAFLSCVFFRLYCWR